MYRFILVSLFVLFIFSGCSKDKEEKSLATGDILAATWQLSDMGGKKLDNNINTTLNFAKDHKISGNTGCNNYFGTYELLPYENGFKISNIGSTRKMCPEKIMERETSYLEALSKANSIKFDDNKLEIGSDDKISSLKFVPENN